MTSLRTRLFQAIAAIVLLCIGLTLALGLLLVLSGATSEPEALTPIVVRNAHTSQEAYERRLECVAGRRRGGRQGRRRHG